MNRKCGFIVLLGTLITTMQTGCKRNDSLSPRFGIAQITLPGGSSVYLKRQVRGLTYDELAISPDGDKCTPANPETDYIFDGLGAGAFPVFYSASQGELTVYDTMSLNEPKRPIQGVRVVVKKLSPSEYDELSKSGPMKANRIKVDVEAQASCP